MSLRRTPPTGETVNARPWRGLGPPARILAIRIQAMGDTVATFPYLHALRRELPDTELDFLTHARYADLARSVRLADHVFELGGWGQRAQMFSALTLLPRLWPRAYDVVIDLQRNRPSQLLRYLLRARAWSEFDRYSPVLGGERYRLTIEATGLRVPDVYPDLELRDPEAGREKLLAAGWDGRADLVALNPGGLSGDRQWPIERYAAFARRFAGGHARPTRFLLLGLPKVADKAAALRDRLGDRVIDLVGATSLSEIAALVKRTILMVSEDAGLLHVAWVLGVPSVGLFGASRAVWARPHGNYGRLVLACAETDGACMDGRCRKGPPACLHLLAAERVHRAALEALRPPEGGKALARGGRPCLVDLAEP